MACNPFKAQKDLEGVAVKVGDAVLTFDELNAVVPKGASAEDSILFTKNYIDQWALNQLLVGQSKLNLPKAKQDQLNEMVETYQNNLYTKAYKELIINKDLDTIINDAELKEYFENSKESFKLNEELLQVRYIFIPNYTNRSEKKSLKEQLLRFNEKDKKELDSLFNYNLKSWLKDSLWIRYHDLEEKLLLSSHNLDVNQLKNNTFVELKDSLGDYLLKVEQIKRRGEQAPYQYLKKVLKDILINKRKLELQKTLEKDLLEDAYSKGEIQVFESKKQ